MAQYVCTVCQFVYDEAKEPQRWDELQDEWLCPVRYSPKSVFKLVEEATSDSKEEMSVKIAEAGGFVEPGSGITPFTTVSDVMVDAMVNWGIKYVFGMVGHSNLGLAEAIRRHCEAGELNYIGVRNE